MDRRNSQTPSLRSEGDVPNNTTKDHHNQNGIGNHSFVVDIVDQNGTVGEIITHTTLPLPSISKGAQSESLHPTQTNREAMKRVVVLGSGDFGLALTARLVQANYHVVVGSRNPERTRQRVLNVGASIMKHEEAMQQSNVVVMAIPFTHVASLPVHHLAGKIVIDVSNRTAAMEKSLGSQSQAEQLQAVLPSARVVKAFNVLSAYALTRGNMGTKEVPVCSDDEAARRLVCEIAQDLRFTPIDYGLLVNARQVESIPLQFFPEWRGAFITSVAIWIGFFLILFYELQLCKNLLSGSQDWSSLSSLPTKNLSVACGDTSITLLALCYLPGVIAAYLQLSRGTKYSRFPGWLDNWLKSRKQLGLLMLLNAVIHVILKIAGSPLSWGSDWQTTCFIACGCITLVMASILGITSLPSVAGNMTWREFAFVQSVLGWFTLLTATLHLVFRYLDSLFKPNFVCYMPSSGQFVMVLPLLTLLFKLPLILPCVDKILVSIRQGYNRTPSCFSRSYTNTDN